VTELPVALLNIRDGCRVSFGAYDFSPLRRVFADVATPPAILAVNEAKDWGLHGKRGLRLAVAELRRIFDVPYVGEVGVSPRGPAAPALVYDPCQVHVDFWGDPSRTLDQDGCPRCDPPRPALVYDPRRVHLDVWGERGLTVAHDKHNLALCHTVDGQPFAVLVDHWSPFDGNDRLARAKIITTYGLWDQPLLLAGDLNGTASGPHWPTRDWLACPYQLRHAKGVQAADSSWSADTRAVDQLIGRWNPGIRRRDEGAGFHAVPELALAQGMADAEAMCPTSDVGEYRGGELVIDLMLLNQAWVDGGGLVPGTFRVHRPPPGCVFPDSWFFDHWLTTATLLLRRRR